LFPRACAGGYPTMTMKLPKKATTVPSKGFWNSGLRAFEIVKDIGLSGEIGQNGQI
jgi:hypothetical protein